MIYPAVQHCQNVSTKTLGGARVSETTSCGCIREGCVFVSVSMWLGYALVCDILALHLVQVVLSPQSPLETPEDRESNFYARLHSNEKHTYSMNLKGPTCLINLHFSVDESLRQKLIIYTSIIYRICHSFSCSMLRYVYRLDCLLLGPLQLL